MAEPPLPIPRRLPVVYFAAGHLCLTAAFLVAALDPAPFAATFLHPRVVAAVHLVTLGWITPMILGALTIVAPLALRLPLRTTRLDGWACGGVLLGMSGVVSHFWIVEFSGIAWSGGLLLLACGAIAVKVLGALRAATATPTVIRVHIGLAFGNLLLAMLLGTWLAVGKTSVGSVARPMAGLIAHAHLAAVGWGVMMAVGIGHRLLPMFLPAAPPPAALGWVSAVALEAGVLGLVVAWVWAPGVAPFAATALAVGVAAFLVAVLTMLRQRRPPPRALRRPDPGALQALQAVLYLVIATGLGLWLAWSAGPFTPWAVAYGACALVGFLAQLVLGIAQRLLPLFAWRHAWADGGQQRLPATPHAMPSRPLQLGQLAAWTAGVPALVLGLGLGEPTWIAAGAWALALGTVLAGINSALVLRHASVRDAGPADGPAAGVQLEPGEGGEQERAGRDPHPQP